jgi:fructose-1,6-bisphosphatase/sedoheptulose 1,7-bisphosphatase-like protein
VAAIAAARTMGQGDRKYSDQVAVEAMREEMDKLPMRGRIVIGEGERDEAPMLYIGEEVGRGWTEAPRSSPRSTSPSIRSKARTSARPAPQRHRRARRLRARRPAERARHLHGQDRRRPLAAAARRHRRAGQENLKAIAAPLQRDVDDLTVIVLDRERHQQLIADDPRGRRAHPLIGDGDLSAGISAAVRGTGVHALMGIGGAPEGVLTAAAMRCLGGEMQGRLKVA